MVPSQCSSAALMASVASSLVWRSCLGARQHCQQATQMCMQQCKPQDCVPARGTYHPAPLALQVWRWGQQYRASVIQASCGLHVSLASHQTMRALSEPSAQQQPAGDRPRECHAAIPCRARPCRKCYSCTPGWRPTSRPLTLTPLSHASHTETTGVAGNADFRKHVSRKAGHCTRVPRRGRPGPAHSQCAADEWHPVERGNGWSAQQPLLLYWCACRLDNLVFDNADPSKVHQGAWQDGCGAWHVLLLGSMYRT